MDAEGGGMRGERRGASRDGRATARGCALRSERAGVPKGEGERFAGYGVIALPFRGGDVLAFRHFPASSIGAGYSAIWHRDRAGAWTFYVTTDPSFACPRYFGDALERVVVTDIEVTWVGHDHLVVAAPAPRVEWSMRLQSSMATRAVNLLGGLAPGATWRDDRLLNLAGVAAGLGLGAGALRLAGHTPNGQHCRFRPRKLWRIDASAARVEGRELGPIGGNCDAELGDFRLPDTGLFACGSGEFERLDPRRHSSRIARRVERA